MWIVYKHFKLKSFFLRNHLTYTNKLEINVFRVHKFDGHLQNLCFWHQSENPILPPPKDIV